MINKYWVQNLMVVLILVVGYGLSGMRTFTKGPVNVHLWSQSDWYAVSLGYVNNSLKPWKPSTLVINKPIKPMSNEPENFFTSADFALVPWLSAVVMKISDCVSPLIFRLISLLLLVIGMLALFWTFRISGMTLSTSIILLSLFAFMPVLALFSNGFLPTTHAIALLCIAVFFFVKYLGSSRTKWVFIAAVFFLLAALVRPPFVFGLLAVTIALWFRHKKLDWVIFGYGVTVLLFIAWYGYKIWMARHLGTLFLVFPPDGYSFADSVHNLLFGFVINIKNVVPVPAMLLIGLWVGDMHFRKIRLRKGRDTSLLFTIFFLIVGFELIYLIVMAGQFLNHNYYWLDVLVPPMIFGALGLGSYNINYHKQLTVVLSIVFTGAMFNLAVNYSLATNSPEFLPGVDSAAQGYYESSAAWVAETVPSGEQLLVYGAFAPNVPFIALNRSGYCIGAQIKEPEPEVYKFPIKTALVPNALLPQLKVDFPGWKSHFTEGETNGIITVWHKK